MSGLATLALILAVILVLIYSGQTRLIFFPQALSNPPPAAPDIEEIRLTAADGTRLHGWFARSGRSKAPLLIYFGGNAEEVSWMLDMRKHFPGWSLLAMNYRGYGLSEGRPGEAALFADALQTYDFASARADVDPARIALLGRSLGSGVAVHLAASRPVRAVVLVSPYDSLTALAQRHYPWLPAALLLRHRFDSIARAPGIAAPLLCLVADRDTIVPPEHSRRLYEAWAGPRQWREIAPADHDSIAARTEYWQVIQAFLGAIAAAVPPQSGHA